MPLSIQERMSCPRTAKKLSPSKNESAGSERQTLSPGARGVFFASRYFFEKVPRGRRIRSIKREARTCAVFSKKPPVDGKRGHVPFSPRRVPFLSGVKPEIRCCSSAPTSLRKPPAILQAPRPSAALQHTVAAKFAQKTKREPRRGPRPCLTLFFHVIFS